MSNFGNLQRGGARNRVPEPGKDLPDIKSLEDFKTKINFYSIIGHGIMSSSTSQEGTVFIVPPKTYIFFITRAGIPGEKVKTGAIKKELDNLYYPAESNTTGKDWSKKIYDSMIDGTLLQDVLYKKETAFREDIGYAVYEPGDLVQNLTIAFHNPTFPYMMLGIWKLPIDRDLKKYLDDINNRLDNFPTTIKEYTDAILVEANSLPSDKKATVENIMIPFFRTLHRTTAEEESKVVDNEKVQEILRDYPKIAELRGKIYKMYLTLSSLGNVEDHFLQNKDNLLQQFPSIQRTRESTLYNILNESYSGRMSGPPILSTTDLRGKETYRFIVVDACRSIDPKRDVTFERTLRRSLSGYMRPEICMTSLLKLTKDALQALPSVSKLSEGSVIKKLLRGEEVVTSEFESELAPLQIGSKKAPYTFSHLLNYHSFNEGNEAYRYSLENQMKGKRFPNVAGQIGKIDVAGDGSIQYEFLDPMTGNVKLTPALNLWKSSDIYYTSERKREQEYKKMLAEYEKAEENAAKAKAAQNKHNANVAAELQRQTEERDKQNAARKAAQEALAAAQEQTFKDLADKIAALPEDKRKLISPNRPIQIKLPEPSAEASPEIKKVYRIFNNRFATVKAVSLNKQGQLTVLVHAIYTGGEESMDDRSFRYDFLYPRPAAPKKGGRRKTRRSEKAKNKKRTRRH